MSKIWDTSSIFVLGFEEFKGKNGMKKSNSWGYIHLELDLKVDNAIGLENIENQCLPIQSSSSSGSGSLDADICYSLTEIPIKTSPLIPKKFPVNNKRRSMMPLKRLKVIDE